MVYPKYQSYCKQRAINEVTFCKVVGFLVPAAHASDSDRLPHLWADVCHAHDLVSIEAEQFDLRLDFVGDLESKISANLRLVAYISEPSGQDFFGDCFNSSCERREKERELN